MHMNKNLFERVKCENALNLDPYGFQNLIIEAVRPELPYLARGGEEPIELLDSLEYIGISLCKWKKLKDIEELDSANIVYSANPGGSEGVYLDVSFEIPQYGADSKVYHIMTCKTLGENIDAYAAMGCLGGALQYAIELFFMANIW